MSEVERYQRLLTILENERVEVERELKVLLQELRGMEVVLDDLEGRLMNLVDPDPSENYAAELRVLRSADARLRGQMTSIEAQMAEYELQILDPVRQRLNQATIRCKTMSKLIERKNEEADLEARRKENVLLDEMGSLRWRRRASESSQDSSTS